jgi:hypothetical protein
VGSGRHLGFFTSIGLLSHVWRCDRWSGQDQAAGNRFRTGPASRSQNQGGLGIHTVISPRPEIIQACPGWRCRTRRCGGCSTSGWAGACSGLSARPKNATRKRSSTGWRTSGRGLTKVMCVGLGTARRHQGAAVLPLPDDSYDTDWPDRRARPAQRLQAGQQVMLLRDGLSAHWSYQDARPPGCPPPQAHGRAAACPRGRAQSGPFCGPTSRGGTLANCTGDTIAKITDEDYHGIQ